MNFKLSAPYLLFLGDVTSEIYAKTAFGLVQWAPEKCIGQHRFPSCDVDTGIRDMSIAEAAAAGAKSLLIGVAPVGGNLQDNWLPCLLEAVELGMDIISGLHSKLSEYPKLCTVAELNNVQLINVRLSPESLPIGKGEKRKGMRLLTVGTDCSVGKKYTALAITKALKTRDVSCDFRATGQTGIMIAGSGIPIDSVVADFIAGAAEILSPNNAHDHWDIIEGQGSLFNPAYAGVSLGLLHGSQPDAIVVCHDPTRKYIVGCQAQLVPSLQTCIDTNLVLARLTNPAVQCVGVSLNTSQIASDRRNPFLQSLAHELAIPCIDPLINSVDAIVDKITF